MDTGTKAASIQSSDVAAALLFRIASAIFIAQTNSAAAPESKQEAYGHWYAIRQLAARVALSREFPPVDLTLREFTAILQRAHYYAAVKLPCTFGNQQDSARQVRDFQLCDCGVAGLCCSATALIFTPGGRELLSHEGNGGRGQSPELRGGASIASPLHPLATFLDDESLGMDPL